MTTFADMMTLLMCFFVLLVTFMEVREEKWAAVAEEIKEAFGVYGGGKLPIEDNPAQSLIERLEKMAAQQQKHQNRSNTDDPGIEGKETQVTRVREGLMFAVGGKITFEPGSDQLSAVGRQELDKIADLVRGFNNVVEIRGHAAANEMALGQVQMEKPASQGRYSDLWQLSAARARAVLNYLTSDQVGIRHSRLRLVANADREPLVQRAYTAAEQQPNRRVEVFVSEALTSQFTAPESSGSG